MTNKDLVRSKLEGMTLKEIRTIPFKEFVNPFGELIDVKKIQVYISDAGKELNLKYRTKTTKDGKSLMIVRLK